MSALARPDADAVANDFAHIRAGMDVSGAAIAVEWAYLHGDAEQLRISMALLTTTIDRMESTRRCKQKLRAQFLASMRAENRKRPRRNSQN